MIVRWLFRRQPVLGWLGNNVNLARSRLARHEPIRLETERSSATVFQPLHHDGDFKAAQHSRRETIVKIIPVSTGTSWVFIITSKFGHVGIYDDKLRVQRK